MGILQRLALVLKSYLASTSDRLERVAAEEELKLAKTRKDALKELDSSIDVSASIGAKAPGIPSAPAHVPDKLASDYRILGLEYGADLEAVEGAWRKLALRADPKRFPPGSDEEKRAAEILKSINEAYARIREALNPTEGRFGRLEL